MYFLNYLGEALKAAALLIGLNGSAEKISIEDAFNYIDARVKKIESDYDLVIDNNLIKDAKKALIILSHRAETVFSLVEKAASGVEQQVMFGHDNETIELSQMLKNLRGVYHYRANTQSDGISCGQWCVANAKAIDVYLSRRSILKFKKINKLSKKFFQQMIAMYPPKKLLKGVDINDAFACKKYGDHKLNNTRVQKLADELNADNIEGFAKLLCDNKLHIINAGSGEIKPDFLVCDNHIEKGKTVIKRIIKRLLIENEKHNTADFVRIVLDYIIKLSCRTNLLEDEVLWRAKTFTGIDVDFLDDLLKQKDLNEDGITRIQSLINTNTSSVIDAAYFAGALDDYDSELTSESFGFSDFSELLTVVNLLLIIINDKNAQRMTRLTEQGGLYGLMYFSILSHYFQERCRENENCAIHFACLAGIHWILISVMYLADKRPALVIVDSINHSIVSNWIPVNNEPVLNESTEEAKKRKILFFKELREDPEKSKIFYILFLYDLFINGDIQVMEKLRDKLTEHENRVRGDDSNYEEDIKRAKEASLAFDQDSCSEDQLPDCIKSKNGVHVDLYRRYLNGEDICVGKGKEKERQSDYNSNEYPEEQVGPEAESSIQANGRLPEEEEGREKSRASND